MTTPCLQRVKSWRQCTPTHHGPLLRRNLITKHGEPVFCFAIPSLPTYKRGVGALLPFLSFAR